MRRALRAGLGLCLLVAPLGCASWAKKDFDNPQDQAPLTTEVPQPMQLVNYLNQEAYKLQTIDAGELDIRSTVKGRSVPRVSGWVVCDKPRNFRMMAKHTIGGPQVDFGSNENEFWFWIKEGPPYLFHCAHEDFQRGVEMPFPVQPDWVLEALGMAEYDPEATYTVEVRGRTLELSEDRTLFGQAVKKVTIFNAVTVDAPEPQVIGHVVKRPDGTILSAATIREVGQYFDPTSGQQVIYPKVVQLSWPSEELTMELELDEVVVNEPLTPRRTASLFSRPQMRDIPDYNLAQRPLGLPSSRVQAAGGYSLQNP